MAIINVDDAYILNETGAQVDKVTGLFTKDENTTAGEKAFAQLNIGASGGGGGRNLLDNPWFTVQQRGAGPFTGAGYTADRWSIAGSAASATLTSNGLSVSLAAGAPVLQRLGFELELDVPYTVSILEQNGTMSTATFTPTAGRENVLAVGDYLLDFDTRSAYAPYYRFMIYKNSAWTADFRAFKLEKGTASTLANDAPPNYAEELAKCQFYFERIKNNTSNYAVFGSGVAVSTSAAYIVVPMHPKRVQTYTVTMSGAKRLLNKVSAGGIAVSSITKDAAAAPYAVCLYVAGASALTDGATYLLQANNDSGSYIDINADL